MNFRARYAEAAFYATLAIILAILTHFVAVLTMPLVAERDAYSRLAKLGGPNETVELAQTSPVSRGFPYADPAVATAFCRFDLANGPVRVRAPIGRAGFASLSVHTRRGAVVYAITDRAATHGYMEAVVANAAQLRALVAEDDEDNPSEDLRIVSPTNEGFVLTRVLSELPDLYGEAEAQAKALDCAAEPSGK